MIMLYLSTIPLPVGLYDVFLVSIPLEENHSLISLEISDVALSECKYDAITKTEDKLLRFYVYDNFLTYTPIITRMFNIF